MVGRYRMLPPSPNSRPPTAFISSRYRQTTLHARFNSFNCCQCLVRFLAFKRLSETPNQTPPHPITSRRCQPSAAGSRRILRSTSSIGLPFCRYTCNCQACRRCIRDHEGYGMHHHSIDKPEHNSEEIEIQHLI